MKKTAPYLMQQQENPFNGDRFMAEAFIHLRDKYGVKTVLELGSFIGTTTKWFAENFENVYSCEINSEYHAFAVENLKEHENCFIFNKSSEDFLKDILPLEAKGNFIVFMDSHWYDHWPILAELGLLKKKGVKPILVIHDFKVPGHELDLGFDSYKGQDLSMEYIVEKLKALYDGNFTVEYNSPEKAEGAKRGVAYVYPFELFVPEHEEVIEQPEKEEEPAPEPALYEFVEAGDTVVLNTGERLKVIGVSLDGNEASIVDNLNKERKVDLPNLPISQVIKP